MTPNDVTVRQARPGDCPGVLALMRLLAEFEGYEKEFKVTENALHGGLFEQQKFHVLVAIYDQVIVGELIYYFLPFTYDLSPWIYIKELYVSAPYRSLGVGKALMTKLIAIGDARGSTKIRWDVLASNRRAKKFYRSLGARHEQQWELFSLAPASCQARK